MHENTSGPAYNDTSVHGRRKDYDNIFSQAPRVHSKINLCTFTGNSRHPGRQDYSVKTAILVQLDEVVILR